MPPEQLKGEALDQRADIYAWGATAYELLTHLRPFGGGTPEESRRNQLDEKYYVKPAHQHNPQVPAALSQLIGRCLAHKPEARYPNMTVMNAQLHSILGVQHQPITPSNLALA
jgi:serine/threonine protein kinase